MEKLKLENWESSVVLPSYEDLIGENRKKDVFGERFALEEYDIVFEANGDLVEFWADIDHGICVTQGRWDLFDEPFSKENYEKALEVLKDLLSKKESK